MRSRLTRVLLVLIGIALGATAGYFLIEIDNQMKAERRAVEQLRESATALAGTIAEMRTAQVAYVARGQGEAFWIERVSQLNPTVERHASEFFQSLTSVDAQDAFEAAAGAIENFQKLDARVQEYVRDGSSLLAADLIFSDGLESTRIAAARVEEALRIELPVREAATAALRKRQLSILAASSGAILLLLLALGLSGAQSDTHAAAVVPSATDTLAHAAVVKSAASTSQAAADATQPHMEPMLAETARLCSDLARVFDPTQLPALLERAANVLNATGIIVWTADATGAELRPAMSHGYSSPVVARMGGIPREASNAVAIAYRSGVLRTVPGDDRRSGAVAAPMTTTEGCVGVLSAEMKGGAESTERSQALATIIAAQLAVLVSPATAVPAKIAAQG